MKSHGLQVPDLKVPWWFKVWFALCAVVGLAALAGVGWLGFAVIQWLGRH